MGIVVALPESSKMLPPKRTCQLLSPSRFLFSVKNLTMTRSKKRQAAVAADISNEASDDRHADGAKKRVTSRYWTPQVRNGHDASRVIN